MDDAEYIGPLEQLRGKRALVLPDETYHLPLEQRTLRAQFHDHDVIHPIEGWKLSLGWYKFPAKDFALLVRV